MDSFKRASNMIIELQNKNAELDKASLQSMLKKDSYSFLDMISFAEFCRIKKENTAKLLKCWKNDG